MNQLRTISFFLASLCLFSCQNSNELEEYYFPVDSFKNPVTYCFINDDGHEQFWRMTYVDSRKHLITEMYNGKFELTDSIVESISGSSADIQAFYSKHNGSLDKVDVKKSRVFNFDSKLEDSFGWEIVFHHDESDMILEKTRELIDNNYLIEFGVEKPKRESYLRKPIPQPSRVPQSMTKARTFNTLRTFKE